MTQEEQRERWRISQRARTARLTPAEREARLAAKQTRNHNGWHISREKWAKHIKKRYGISLEIYDAMLVRQNNKCAICGRDFTEFKQRPHIDHNHETQELRGILCC